jgi:general secretion pathway protein D
MSENLSDTFTKVPLLGDIPLLGHLFKTTSKSKTKTELIIMIKPVIITSTEEAVKLTNELKQSFKWLK